MKSPFPGGDLEGAIMEVFLEFFRFLKQRKRYWLWPLCIVLVLLATFLVIAQGSALAPFIYSLF
jgi:hypothetical protein